VQIIIPRPGPGWGRGPDDPDHPHDRPPCLREKPSPRPYRTFVPPAPNRRRPSPETSHSRRPWPASDLPQPPFLRLLSSGIESSSKFQLRLTRSWQAAMACVDAGRPVRWVPWGDCRGISTRVQSSMCLTQTTRFGPCRRGPKVRGHRPSRGCWLGDARRSGRPAIHTFGLCPRRNQRTQPPSCGRSLDLAGGARGGRAGDAPHAIRPAPRVSDGPVTCRCPSAMTPAPSSARVPTRRLHHGRSPNRRPDWNAPSRPAISIKQPFVGPGSAAVTNDILYKPPYACKPIPPRIQQLLAAK